MRVGLAETEHCRIDRLTNILKSGSKGHYCREKTVTRYIPHAYDRPDIHTSDLIV